MKGKKLICIIAVLALLLSMMLAGCGQKETRPNETTANVESATTGQATTEAQLEPVNLRWILPKVQTQNEPQPVFDAANKMIKEKINATVSFDMLEMGQYENKIKTLVAAGEEADLFFTSSWFNNYYKLAASGGLYDISGLLDKTPQLKAKFPDYIWNALKIGGKIYAVPDQSVFVRKLGLELRKDLVEKYKLDYQSIKKLKDVEPFLKSVKENEKDVIPIDMVSNSWFGMQSAFGWEVFVGMNIPGAGYNFKDTKVFNQFETQEFKDFVYMMHDWYKKGYIPEDAATTDNKYLSQGKCAVVLDPAAYPGQDAIFSNSTAGGTPYILSTGMEVDAAIQGGSIASNLTSVCSTSKNPERALMLVELVNFDKELFNTIVWGIEGTNYTKNADGTIEQIKDGKYEGIYNFFTGDMLNTYVQKGQPLDMYEQMDKLNKSGKPSSFLGFVFNPEPVKTDISNLTTVTDQYLTGLTTGYVDPDKYYPEFVDKLKKAGVDKVIAEMQKQVDEWVKNK